MLFIKNIKKFFFPFYKTREIREIFKILNHDKKNNAMLVGGCVRNFLSNEKIGDIDIATIFTPGEIIKKFASTKFKIIKSGISHGTLTLTKNGKSFELTTLREDVNTDGRHATVSFTRNWEKDSKRRDFTINSIYLDQYGKIYDPQGGREDLKTKRIRFIGDPQKRIEEDYLRIIRYLRFSIQYNDFNLDKETLTTIKKNLTGILKLSKERVFSELNKIINLKNVIDISLNQEFHEIFKIIFPEFKYLERLKEIKNNNLYKKFLKSDKNLLLALLLIDETDNHIYFTHKYKTSNLLKERLNFFYLYFFQAKKNKNFFLKDLKKNIFYHNKDQIKSLAKFYFLMLYPKNSFKLEEVLNIINSTNVPEFPITGKYLLEKGFKSGRKIGEVLKKIEKHWIENDFHLKDEELNNFLKKYI